MDVWAESAFYMNFFRSDLGPWPCLKRMARDGLIETRGVGRGKDDRERGREKRWGQQKKGIKC